MSEALAAGRFPAGPCASRQPGAEEALGESFPLVAAHGTGLQLTRVHHEPGGGFLWWHGPGPGRTGPLRAPGRLLARVPAPAAASGAALLSTGTPYGDGLLHRAAGSASAAAWLRDPRPQAGRLVAHALVAAGRALRLLHDVPLPPDLEPVDLPGVRRMRAWAAGTGPSAPAAVRLRQRAREVWGRARTALLLDWAHDALRPAGPGDVVAPLHGWASAGALVPPRTRGRVALLTGEDLGVGRRELDLGWMLGDLVELAWSSPLYGGGQGRRSGTGDGPDAGRADPRSAGLPSAAALQAVFLRAYGDPGAASASGPAYDPAAVGRCAVIRVVTHMQDFATYCEWSDELLDYLAFTAELIDEEGRRAVPRGVS
ncbi:hypothetical protein EES43_13165 [Streptomyces sp. ADI96-02]|uniref:hypothetical protein n=1 Tax=Streptomyces sp. ADI96-02 TaxID=1522760 RepID=UPI000FAA72A3|nr:hypothetical protein [Streptomyces sp. ADI96-02]RPK62636.1 hypothetical protein EES43_13165 [Streptomyces sp. ADI96-02]